MLNIILLAAGTSSRMGEANKLLLPFRDRSLFESTLEQIEKAAIGDILVVVGHEAERLRPLLAGHVCRVTENPDYAQGMSSSIRAGVSAASADTSGFLIGLSDMPLISAAEYRILAENFRYALEQDSLAIVQPAYEGQRGNPVLFSATYRDALCTLSDPNGARQVVQANRDHLLLVDMPSDGVLLDADTPEAYTQLLSRLKPDSI